MNRPKAVLVWLALALAIFIPVLAAAVSPLLEWRQPIYIIAGFAGIFAMICLLVQPLLAGRYLPNISIKQNQFAHRWIGILLVIGIIVHVAGLWITSPPDVVDALLFRSPTQFSVWGVTAMWCAFAAALLAAFRKGLHMPPRIWRFLHSIFAAIIVLGTIIHALLIEGTMETFSKIALCMMVAIATIKLFIDLKIFVFKKRKQ